MRVLLAGPGTGKTTKIKTIISNLGNGSNVLVVSFTNATVKDLIKSLGSVGITKDNCMTLHKLAVKYNHDRQRHVLQRGKETDELEQISKATGIDFNRLCDHFSCTTFNQMIDRFVSYAKANPEYLRDKLSNYKVLIVDEYQDFNPHEQALIDVLIELIPDAYILGDDDQCIYDFKNASGERIIAMHADPSNQKVEHTHVCYRCPDKVIHHATSLIKLNTERVDKPWHKNGKAGEIIYKQVGSFDDIAEYVDNQIKEISRDYSGDSILVLTPVRFVIDRLVEVLKARGVEYDNYFSENITDELVIRSWKVKTFFGQHRYLNLALLSYFILSDRRSFYSLIKTHFERGQNFEELLDFIKARLPIELQTDHSSIDQLLAMQGFEEISRLYANAPGENEDEKLEKIFASVDKENSAKLKIMSIHKSKGLDADHVFMVGLTEGIIPNKKEGNRSLESQRRLFYVGMTRTRKNLHLISNVKVPGKHANQVNIDDFKYDYKTKLYNGRASTFIEELGL